MNLGIGKMVKNTPGFIEGTTNAMSYDNLSGVAGNAQMVIDYCMKKGLTRAAGCGVAANIQAESGFRTNAVGDHNTSFGLCQWHNKRGTAMMQFCESLGVKWNESFTGQMDYLWSELTSSYKGVYNVLANASDTLAGAITCCNKWIYSYEVPQGYKDPDSDVYKKRQQYTRDIYNGGWCYVITYGFAKSYYYAGDGTLQIKVRIPSIHGPYRLSDSNGKTVRNYVTDDNLPFYQSVLLPHTPTDGEVVMLASTNDSNNEFVVLGLTGASYTSVRTQWGEQTWIQLVGTFQTW